MSAVTVPANATEALRMLQCAMGYLADLDAASLPAEVVAECLRGMECADAVGAAARGRLLAGSMRPAARWATGSGPAVPGWCTLPG